MSRAGRVLAALAASATLAVGCAQLAGIDEAELDPAFLDGGQTDSGSGLSALCADYCASVQTNCTGALAQWADEATCLAACQYFDPGEAGDQTGNTVNCRLTNAEAVVSTGEAAVQCPVAGPGGEDICGSPCEGYCTLMQAVCGDSSSGFESLAECLTACEALPDLGRYDASQQSGNSVQCRLYHVSAATVISSIHCPHAAGAFPCD